MSLRDLNLNISYGPSDDRLNGFFVPALGASVRYDRAAGYFSSTTLAVAAQGVARLLANGGTMRLLVGADLSEDDVEAIRKGADIATKVAGRLQMRLKNITPDTLIHRRLEALAWMVSTGQLEIQVVLPKGSDGHPLPASRAESYYHPKEGLFTDAEGNQVAFSGSINESATAIENNYESFCVYFSWNESKPYLAQVRRRFDRLWDHTEENWIAMPIPEAVKQELLTFRPASAPRRDPLEPREPEPVPPIVQTVEADQRERILFRFVRDVPQLLNGGQVGVATCAVRPWPHQVRVVDTLVSRYPQRFMLCDEVGLGKTIEAGLALRQLIISRRVKRALILVPKSVLKQWQEELYEKLVLSIARYDGQDFRDVFDRELQTDAANPWDAFDLLLSSSHLAKRRERQEQLAEAHNWDLIIIDEAHHARRKDFLNRDQFRPNRLLELLNGTASVTGLKNKTKGLWLATATPMQIDPVEVWDLLKVLGLGGRWGACEDNFLRYFEELQKAKDSFPLADWPFVLGMLGDYLNTAGSLDENFAKVAESKLGPVEWSEIQSLPSSSNPAGALKQLSDKGRGALIEMARRHTPIRHYVHRNTRSLLRVYRERGLLKENVPARDPASVFVYMKPDEQELYQRIEEYIRDFYHKYEAERRGLGFIMTVYRRRLTSSFYAMRRSLERRLQYLKGGQPGELFDDDDLGEADLQTDVEESLLPTIQDDTMRKLLLGEINYVEDFLADIRKLGSDSKMEQLLRDVDDFLKRRDSVIIFTQYTDTMDYLREKLRQVYGAQVACYSGRGGEYWEGGRWVGTSKERIKNAFREGTQIKLLLCTESASEGLNLQTCGVLINWDMPWNPMRVEQRIGRIDRIGQRYPKVWISNYFYQGTVEAEIYHRLDERIASFETVVGELQPILARVGRVIEQAAMASDVDRKGIIEREVAAINEAVKGQEVSSLNLDRFVDDAVEGGPQERPPITLTQLEALVVKSEALGPRFQPHPQIPGAHLLDWDGDFHAVTFNPSVFDEHPNSLKLLSFGSKQLEEILAAVDDPAEADSKGVVARCRSSAPIEAVAYFGRTQGGIDQLRTYDGLCQLLDRAPACGAVRRDDSVQLRDEFMVSISGLLGSEARIEESRRRSDLSAIEEECRHLLLEAAYVELAKGSQPDLFEDVPPPEFSIRAIQALVRHGYPFKGAVANVSLVGLSPRSDDPGYTALLKLKRDALERRLSGITGRLKDAFGRLVAARKVAASSTDSVKVAPEMTSQIYSQTAGNGPLPEGS